MRLFLKERNPALAGVLPPKQNAGAVPVMSGFA